MRYTYGRTQLPLLILTTVNTLASLHPVMAVLTLLEHQERRAHCLSADGTAHSQLEHPHHSSTGRCFSGDAAGHCLQAGSSVAGW